MSRLLYSATMSLDGFIAGPGGDMSWLTEHLGAPNPEADALLADIGCLLVGANTFGGDDPNAGTDKEGAFGGAYDGPAVVLTHHPRDDAGVVFETDLASAVASARRLAGDRYVNVLGAHVAKQCLEAGELDEVLVFVAPVLLGDGTPLFAHPGGRQVRLESLGRDSLWFRVVSPA